MSQDGHSDRPSSSSLLYGFLFSELNGPVKIARRSKVVRNAKNHTPVCGDLEVEGLAGRLQVLRLLTGASFQSRGRREVVNWEP